MFKTIPPAQGEASPQIESKQSRLQIFTTRLKTLFTSIKAKLLRGEEELPRLDLPYPITIQPGLLNNAELAQLEERYDIIVAGTPAKRFKGNILDLGSYEGYRVGAKAYQNQNRNECMSIIVKDTFGEDRDPLMNDPEIFIGYNKDTDVLDITMWDDYEDEEWRSIFAELDELGFVEKGEGGKRSVPGIKIEDNPESPPHQVATFDLHDPSIMDSKAIQKIAKLVQFTQDKING